MAEYAVWEEPSQKLTRFTVDRARGEPDKPPIHGGFQRAIRLPAEQPEANRKPLRSRERMKATGYNYAFCFVFRCSQLVDEDRSKEKC